MPESRSFKVVIPARYGSTRLPGKPLVMLGDRPMIRHVWEQAIRSAAAEVVVATDDERILRACAEFGAEAVMTSLHHESGSDRIAEVADLRGWADDDIVVNLQGDEPLTPPAIVCQVAENLARRPEAAIATLCTPIVHAGQYHDPHVVKVVRDSNDYALYFSRAPIPWERDTLDMETPGALIACYRHLGIYAYRVGFLRSYTRMETCVLERIERLEQLRALWNDARIHVDEALEVPGQGVDTAEDVARVAACLAQSATR